MAEEKKLGDFCRILNGGTPKSNNNSYWGGGIHWLTPKDMGKLENHFVNKTERQITDKGLNNSSAKLLPENSVILSTRAPIGYVAINSVPMAFNQGCRGLIPNDNLMTEFLYYFLILSKKLLNDLGRGTTFKELPKKSLENIAIPFYSLSKQRKIVTKLNKIFTRIDEIIKDTEARKKEIEFLKLAIFRDCFNCNKNSWQTRDIGIICEVLDKLRKPVTKKDRVSGEYPYYGATGIVDWIDDYIFDEKLVLVGEDGAKWEAGDATAFIADGKYWVNNHAHVLRPLPDLVMHEWIVYYINSIDLSSDTKALTVSKLNQQKLKSIPIPLPPLAEQKKIVTKINKAFTEASKLSDIYKKQIEEYNNLKLAFLRQELQSEVV